jgi:voltage-gated potassium channel
VVDFIEIATGNENLELQMEELSIPTASGFIGENLVSSGFRKETGVIIIGIKKSSGRMLFNPNPHSKLEANDTLIVLGEPAAIQKLEQLVGCEECAGEVIKNTKENIITMDNRVFAHVPYWFLQKTWRWSWNGG